MLIREIFSCLWGRRARAHRPAAGGLWRLRARQGLAHGRPRPGQTTGRPWPRRWASGRRPSTSARTKAPVIQWMIVVQAPGALVVGPALASDAKGAEVRFQLGRGIELTAPNTSSPRACGRSSSPRCSAAFCARSTRGTRDGARPRATPRPNRRRSSRRTSPTRSRSSSSSCSARSGRRRGARCAGGRSSTTSVTGPASCCAAISRPPPPSSSRRAPRSRTATCPARR